MTCSCWDIFINIAWKPDVFCIVFYISASFLGLENSVWWWKISKQLYNEIQEASLRRHMVSLHPTPFPFSRPKKLFFFISGDSEQMLKAFDPAELTLKKNNDFVIFLLHWILQAIVIWDIRSGTKKRGFLCGDQSQWPVFK